MFYSIFNIYNVFYKKIKCIFMIIKKKGQVSIETILIIIFLIVFLIVFNSLSKDTVVILERNKVLDQEAQIANSLYSFLKVQESLINDSEFNIDFNISFKIPEINIPSRNVFCQVYITPKYITVNTYDYEEIITYNKEIDLDVKKINFSKTITKPCGSTLVCVLESSRIKCE
jgi:hypothetical protein